VLVKLLFVIFYDFNLLKNVFFFETDSHYIVQAGLELMSLLSQPLKGWDYRLEPPWPTLKITFFFLCGTGA
jgi:hypothetical protein